jgi:release factor glutamine methyltransferase
MTYENWLNEATTSLQANGVDSARLDAELILAHTLRQPRTYLHAHGEKTLNDRQEDIAAARLELRLDHTPVAYIIGHKEFYGRRFKTTPSALIPRPESEAIIELLADIIPKNLPLLPDKLNLVDVGTGTGCLGITAKLEWPELDVTLTDNSTHALNLTKENAAALHADVHFLKNDLLRGYGAPINIILANLPYVDHSWEVSPDTQAEPDEALYANEFGLALIRQLIDQVELLLRPGGHLILEADLRQHAAIIALAKQHQLQLFETKDLIMCFVRY